MFVDLVKTEDVLRAVEMRGPVIPMEIRKYLGKGDSITIGAALSTLLSKGLVKYTNVKIGGSPFYYVKGQEAKLEILNKYLNDKDKRVFEELKEKKILKDSAQEPLTRVSLRNIPDFAKKIEMTKDNETTIYWRWYLVSEDESVSIIKGEKTKQQEPEKEQEFEKTKQNKSENELEKPEKETEKQETKETLETTKQEIKQEPKEENEKASTPKEEQKTIQEEIPDYDDEFFKQIKSFFEENKIEIKKVKLIRKNSDYEFILELKTPFGRTEYFCKAKSKKKCNEGDLSSAYLQGQNKRLPTVFITTGEITKKAKQKINEEYKGLLIKEI